MQTLYERYAPKMFAICCRYVNDRTAARDLLHDGFLTVFNKMPDFRHEGSFEGWMRRVFVTTSLNYLRKQGLMNGFSNITEAVQLSDPAENALEKMSFDEIMSCMAKLPEGYRTVLNLFAVEGYSHKEIAELLGISEGTSRSQYARARARMMNLLHEMDII